MKFTSDFVIGLEVHAELATDSKLFCSCPTAEGKPNAHTCPTCLGLPGAKPRTNKRAVEWATKLALAFGSTIAKDLIFSRKVYFYPDLVKNFQTTQFEHPIGDGGTLVLADGSEVALTRVHLEEDPGALIHAGGSIAKSSHVLIDYNRSGHPLCEIVTQPVIESPKQAREFLKTLKTLLQYLDIFKEGECILKADANVSIRESGYTRVEIKNIGSFKEIEEALDYEIARQRQAVQNGEDIVVETRGYDGEKTFSLRKKESDEDYGYITDPDLVPLTIEEAWVASIKESLPLLPRERCLKMIEEGVKEADALVLAADFELATLHETIAQHSDTVYAARLVRRDIPRILKYHKLDFSVLDPNIIVESVQLLQAKTITERTLQKVLEEYSNCLAEEKEFSPKAWVKDQGLEAMEDDGQLEEICKNIIGKNAKAVEDYKGGNTASLNFLFGQVMRESKGKADPGEVRALLSKLLSQ